MQSSGMTAGYQGLMQIRQAGNNCAACSSTTNHQHTHLPFEQLRVDTVSFHGQILSGRLRV
jgi:hypothetical protein